MIVMDNQWLLWTINCNIRKVLIGNGLVWFLIGLSWESIESLFRQLNYRWIEAAW